MDIILNKDSNNEIIASEIYFKNTCSFIDEVILIVEDDYQGDVQELINKIENFDIMVTVA